MIQYLSTNWILLQHCLTAEPGRDFLKGLSLVTRGPFLYHQFQTPFAPLRKQVWDTQIFLKGSTRISSRDLSNSRQYTLTTASTPNTKRWHLSYLLLVFQTSNLFYCWQIWGCRVTADSSCLCDTCWFLFMSVGFEGKRKGLFNYFFKSWMSPSYCLVQNLQTVVIFQTETSQVSPKLKFLEEYIQLKYLLSLQKSKEIHKNAHKLRK